MLRRTTQSPSRQHSQSRSKKPSFALSTRLRAKTTSNRKQRPVHLKSSFSFTSTPTSHSESTSYQQLQHENPISQPSHIDGKKLTSHFTLPHTNPTFITNPIFYVNGAPHIGHLFTSLLSETIRAWKRSLGNDTYIMGGTDEHGIKVQEAAEKAGFQSTQEFCDKISATFSTSWDEFGLSPDHFYRTTSKSHIESVQWMWKQLARNGYIYLGKHAGWYCKSDEVFVPESQLVKQHDGSFKTASGHEVIWFEEENFKFQLSHFLPALLQYYKSNPSMIYPLQQLNALLAQSDGLEDISISRLSSNLQWGIDVPNDDSVQYWSQSQQKYLSSFEVTKEPHKVYVWLDALNIYITAARNAAQKIKSKEIIFDHMNPTTQSTNLIEDGSFYAFNDWFAQNPHQLTNQHFAETYQSQMAPIWPPSMHIIGKDIIKFHALYWPAFLIGSGLPLPKQIVSHSHWMVDGKKMSKSLGNVVSPQLLKDSLGIEGAKYAIMRLGAVGDDHDFVLKTAIDLVNAELSDTIGNLAMRCTGKAVLPTGKYPDPLAQYRSIDPKHPFRINTQLAFHHSYLGEAEMELEKKINQLKTDFNNHFSDLRPDRALHSIIDLGTATNVYFSSFEPWKMAKMIKDVDNAEITPEARDAMQKKLDVILYYSIEATRICSLFLRIIVPNSADIILDQLCFPKSHRDRLVDDKMTTFGWHPSLDPDSLGDTSQVVVVPFQKIKPPTASKGTKTNASRKAKEAK